jgi:hypothetical protein
MERLDGTLRRALRGAGVPDAGVLAAVTRAWPAAVGSAIARAAWPQRVARDGTLHVTTVSSTWAFELGRMEEEIRAKLHARRDATPPALRSPGPVPLRERRPPPTPPADGGGRRAASLTSAIDPKLATRCAERPPRASPRPGTARRLIYYVARKTRVLQAFFSSGGRDGNRLYRKRHHCSRGARARPAQARDVHRSTGSRGLHHLVYGWSTTPSTRRSQAGDFVAVHSTRSLGHGRRPRTGHRPT